MRYWVGEGNQNIYILPEKVNIVYEDVIVNRLNLPVYNNFEVKIINALALRNSIFYIDLYGNNLSVQFECCGNDKNNQNIGMQEWLKFSIGESVIWITITMLSNFIFTDNEKLRSLVNSKSNTIKILTYEALLAPLLQAIERLTGLQIVLQKIINQYPKTPINSDYGYCFFSLFNKDNDRMDGHLIVSDKLTETLLSLIHLLPFKKSKNYYNLSFKARLQFGCSSLTFNEIRTLEKGDVIFVEHLFSSDLSVFKVHIYPNLTFIVKNEVSQLMVEKVFEGDENNNNSDEYAENIEQIMGNISGNIVDELQVNLSFELGNIRVTLEELKQLQPGSVFSLDRPLHKAVSIYNNGRLLGIGELVEVDSKIGVRLSEFIGN